MGDQTGSPNAFFLDTSTHVARHWDLPEVQEGIQSTLNGKRLYSSVYVRRQYENTVLRAIVVLHNLLRHSRDIPNAIQRTHRFADMLASGGTGRPREGVRVRNVAVRLWQSGAYEKGECLDRLQRWIEIDWENLFHERVQDPLCDETECVRPDGKPRLNEAGYYEQAENQCNQRHPRPCAMPAFWSERQEDLRALAGFTAPPGRWAKKPEEEMGKARQEAGRILENESPQGQRCWAHLSDAIIAIESRECPESVTVHTLDFDFEPIGECLGIPVEVYRYQPLPRDTGASA